VALCLLQRRCDFCHEDNGHLADGDRRGRKQCRRDNRGSRRLRQPGGVHCRAGKQLRSVGARGHGHARERGRRRVQREPLQADADTYSGGRVHDERHLQQYTNRGVKYDHFHRHCGSGSNRPSDEPRRMGVGGPVSRRQTPGLPSLQRFSPPVITQARSLPRGRRPCGRGTQSWPAAAST